MSDGFDDQTTGPSDTFTEVTQQSWFGRLKNALIGLLVALVLIPLSIGLLAWNENRAVQTARALTEGAGLVVDVAPDRIDPANQRHLVHLAGPLVVPGTLKDPVYPVAAPGAAQLLRTVEMFQWQQTETKETRNKVGGGSETVTTYKYNKDWSTTANDSKNFKQADGHLNPAFPVRTNTIVAQKGTIAAFTVDAATLSLTAPFEPLAPTTLPPGGKLSDGGIYMGADPATPAIGDLRIHFTAAHPETISVVAQQEGTSLAPYTTRNGRTLLMVKPGTVPAAAMFQEAQDDNVFMTWALRIVGVVVMLIGFILLMKPLSVFASVLPFLGDLVGLGTGLVALLLTLVLAPLVIALAWIAVRPLLGGGILLVAIAGGLLLVRAVRSRRMQPATA